jgi:hypothetical protein
VLARNKFFLISVSVNYLKTVQDAFFHFFSMLFNGAYASKFETRWEP